MDKKAIIELLKSGGRFLYFSVLALIGTLLTAAVSSGEIANITIMLFGQVIDLTFVILAVIGFIIKAIDLAVRNSKSTELNGIAPEFLQK